MMKKRFKEDKFLLLFYFLFALAVYWDTVSGNLFNPDSIWNGVYYKTEYEWEASLGRYMLRFWQDLLGGGINASFVTIVCLVEVCLICYSVIYIFHIEQRFWQCIAGMFLILSPSVQGTLTYYYCSAYYLLAYLLILAGIIVLLKAGAKTKWRYLLTSMLMFCISLATYQAYIGIMITIIIIYGIVEVLEPEVSIRKLGVKLGRLLTGMAGGVLLYLLSNKIILKLWEIDANTGRGFDKMGMIQIENLWKELTGCYVNFYQYYFGNWMINNDYGWMPRSRANLLVFLVIAAIWLSILFKMQIKMKQKILAFGGFLLLPIAFMSITICAPEVSIYSTTGVLMLPTMNYLYIFVIILGQKSSFCKGKFGNFLCIASSCCIMIMLGELVSDGHTYMKYCNKKTQYVAYEIAHSIIEYIEPGKEMTVCIAGRMEDGNFPNQYPELKESVQWTTASYGTIWNTVSGSQSCWMNYIKQFLGIQYNGVDSARFDEIITSEEFLGMNDFPEEGSVQKIGDTVTVKLSGF